MNKELCFIIEDKKIYLEQILVDYMEVPLFFLCKEKKQYYIALCVDMEELRYLLAKLSLSDVYSLLHGKMPMRDVILKQQEYWDIISGDDISSDIVTKNDIDMLDISLLPEKNAPFKILTKQLQSYIQQFDSDFFSARYFAKSNKVPCLNESFISFPLIENINKFTDLADIEIENQTFIGSSFYNEEMKSIKSNKVCIEDYKQSRRVEISKNTIIAA